MSSRTKFCYILAMTGLIVYCVFAVALWIGARSESKTFDRIFRSSLPKAEGEHLVSPSTITKFLDSVVVNDFAARQFDLGNFELLGVFASTPKIPGLFETLPTTNNYPVLFAESGGLPSVRFPFVSEDTSGLLEGHYEHLWNFVYRYNTNIISRLKTRLDTQNSERRR